MKTVFGSTSIKYVVTMTCERGTCALSELNHEELINRLNPCVILSKNLCALVDGIIKIKY